MCKYCCDHLLISYEAEDLANNPFIYELFSFLGVTNEINEADRHSR